ncbi:MAG TPA: hypothetical protein VK576_05815 [Thermoleophilia bacterium]|nr:hypothetical protein [Thermoleophilia bacterium]
MGPPRCRFCGLEFGDENELRRHYHEAHEIKGGGETGRDGSDSVVPPPRDDLERTAPDGESHEDSERGDRTRDDETHSRGEPNTRDATSGHSDDESERSGI